MDATHTSDSDSGDYVFVCHDKLRAKKRPTSRVKMLNSHVPVYVDSGASCNVMDKHTFDKLHTKPQLKRATTKLCPYGAKQPLKLHGQLDTLVESSNCYTNAMFYVADGDSTLLSYETALDLKILSEVNSVKEIHDIIEVVGQVVPDIIFCRRSDWSSQGIQVSDWSRGRDVSFIRPFCRRSDWMT